jgi:hypothetical protein
MEDPHQPYYYGTTTGHVMVDCSLTHKTVRVAVPGAKDKREIFTVQ